MDDFGWCDDNDFELDENKLGKFYENDNKPVTDGKLNLLKEELRVKIQARRISEGQEELRVEFEPPKKYQLTPEEELKLEIRKQRNRRSANESRIRRKRKLEELSKEEAVLNSEHRRLRAEVTSLQQFKLKLQTLLLNHSQLCAFKHHFSRDDIVKSQDSIGVTLANERVQESDMTSSATESRNNDISTLPSLNGASREHLRNLAKDKQISMLKAYLKGNQTQPEVQKLMTKINEVSNYNTRSQMTLIKL